MGRRIVVLLGSGGESPFWLCSATETGLKTHRSDNTRYVYWESLILLRENVITSRRPVMYTVVLERLRIASYVRQFRRLDLSGGLTLGLTLIANRMCQ